jgi:hypothetical protein
MPRGLQKEWVLKEDVAKRYGQVLSLCSVFFQTQIVGSPSKTGSKERGDNILSNWTRPLRAALTLNLALERKLHILRLSCSSRESVRNA